MPGQLRFQTVYPANGGGTKLHVRHGSVGGLLVSVPVGATVHAQGRQHADTHRGAQPSRHAKDYPRAANAVSIRIRQGK
jgi:uridine phosphorylase